MKKITTLLILIYIGISAYPQYKKYSFQQPKMGSLFNIVLYSEDSLAAARAAAAAYRLVDTLNTIYSDYLPDSELNSVCDKSGNGEWIKISEPLFTILQTALKASEISDGSFDVTMGPVIRLWRKARKEKRLPDNDSIHAARLKVGFRFIKLDTIQQAIRLQKKGMQIDLGGIAQGETAKRMYARLSELGFPHALVDAAGDIMAGTTPAAVDGWRIGINLPVSAELMEQKLLLKTTAVTTSGDLYQYLELNGKRYSHIIDPRTGHALTESRNVTVIADDGTRADWLTKACSILPLQKALKLIMQFPGTEVQIAMLQKGKPIFYRSPRFHAYFDPQKSPGSVNK
ncbi:MAG: FAD:protein FMN transferase [Chitinophagaceae bacterium]